MTAALFAATLAAAVAQPLPPPADPGLPPLVEPLFPPLAVPAPAPVPAGCAVRYYFLLFAGESKPYKLRNGHTWGTFVKATTGPDGAVSFEEKTLSWLPVDGNVRPLAVKPYAGRLWGLEETVRHYLCMPGRVVMWGPAEIDACRYERAAAMYARLASGAVGFRSIDSFTRRQDVMHCVHALTYSDPVLQSRIQPVLRPGEKGTAHLARLYVRAGGLVNPTVSHDWLLPALGLNKPAIERRTFGD